jgi:hypothetical protein
MFSQKVTDFHTPTDVFDLDRLKGTLKHLYLWKYHLVKLSTIVLKSLYNNKRRYSLVEVCAEDGNKSPRYSPPPVQLNSVFMTPHRKSTRYYYITVSSTVHSFGVTVNEFKKKTCGFM